MSRSFLFHLSSLSRFTMVQELGYIAVAQAVGYRIAKKWCGYDDVTLRAAFEEAFRGNNVVESTLGCTR
jgi:hypothetical protein